MEKACRVYWALGFPFSFCWYKEPLPYSLPSFVLGGLDCSAVGGGAEVSVGLAGVGLSGWLHPERTPLRKQMITSELERDRTAGFMNE
jgi:hypothetical protein